MTRLLVPAIACVGLAFAGTSAQAATLTEGVFHIIGSSAAPASNVEFKVSVYPGNSGFAGVGNVSSTGVVVNETFNNPVVDYRFFTDGGNDNTASTYASGGAGLISDLNPLLFRSGYFGSPDNGNVWTTSDPGAGYVNPADFVNNTMLGNTTDVQGSIDISGLSSGSIYFFYGAYRSTPVFSFTMSDTDGPGADILLTGVGNNDGAQDNEYYVCSVDFLNDAGYDTISFVHPNTRITSNGGSGRFMGLVLTAPPTEPEGDIPEPATMALLGLAAAGLGGYVRRRKS
ncbi:MAG TPA: PEP-CTERM sorting domain-containing protein [Candidatus Anammoximicrobium sp.]|nr:PEP-CTERM sorting domain-containing protein [Candidatus Anammoximicrobium sp.]